jgi:hypothetical protein
MRRLNVLSVLIAVLSAVTTVPAAARGVDLALVLAVDVSGSVNTERFELQRQGYTRAFASREVIEAIAAGENHAIAVTFVEWSGATHQQQMIGWTIISDAQSALSFGSAVGEAPRVFADWTSISGALDFALALFEQVEGITPAPATCSRRRGRATGKSRCHRNGRALQIPSRP